MYFVNWIFVLIEITHLWARPRCSRTSTSRHWPCSPSPRATRLAAPSTSSASRRRSPSTPNSPRPTTHSCPRCSSRCSATPWPGIGNFWRFFSSLFFFIKVREKQKRIWSFFFPHFYCLFRKPIIWDGRNWLWFLTKMLRSVFTDPQSFFDLAILSTFFLIFEFSKANKLYIFL